MSDLTINDPDLADDMAYLRESLQALQKRLKDYRYNVKEIKACLNVASKEGNDNRKVILEAQLSKTHELIQAGSEDLRYVFSIYKKLKGME